MFGTPRIIVQLDSTQYIQTFIWSLSLITLFQTAISQDLIVLENSHKFLPHKARILNNGNLTVK